MAAIKKEINKVINSSSRKPTRNEAIQILRHCGVLNTSNTVKRAYKGIIVEYSNKERTREHV